MQIDPQIRPTGPGELVARLIGDTARVKEGLKGFLVHVVTNGALMLGASAVLIWVDPLLGAIFAVAVFLVICTTLLGTVRVYDKASRHRAKEGRLAESIQHAWRHNTIDDSFALVNQSSGEDEASVTRLQGRTTWMVHIIFGLAVLLLMWQGMRSVATRNLQTGDMLIFMMYLLMMRSPIVQLARQGTRSGKIMACAGRIEQVLRDGEKEEAQSNLPPLQNRVLMDNVKVRRRRSEGGGRRLLIESLVVPAGARIAVVGAHGSGKTTLLQVLSGRETPKRGNILWDDIPILEVSTRNLDTQISRLSQEPAWPKQPLFKYLGLKDSEPDEALLGVLRATGAWSWIKHLGGGLTTRLASESLSVGQRRSLALARALLTPSSLLLLDDPTGCSGRAKQDARLRAILSLAQGKAVMVAMRRLTCADLFDRVLELDRGRIVFNGTPADYLAAGATADVQTDSR
jgi:ABC-type bacteriocin/lantibiotic exporter with double-glycine peptidase domain